MLNAHPIVNFPEERLHTSRCGGYTPVKSCFGNPLPLSLKVPALGLSLLLTRSPVSWRPSQTDRPSLLVPAALKHARCTADILSMMISDEQVHCVVQSLKSQQAISAPMNTAIPLADPSLVAGIVDMLCRTPDLRQDRIESAKRLVNGEMPGSDVLAAKLLGRVLSDSLR